MSAPKHSDSPLSPMSREELKAMRDAQLSRRGFLRRSGVAIVAAGGAAAPAVDRAASVIARDEATPVAPGGAKPAPYVYDFQGVPKAPEEPPREEFLAFSERQAAIVEALTSRILPGTSDDPGAREAGVVYYIDHLLSHNSGIREPTYTAWPYARTYEGDTPPEPDNDETIWVKASEISRYGFQARLSPLDVYGIGIEATENYARQRFGRPVVELEESELDETIWALLDDEVDGFEQFSSSGFFHTLRRHTAEGMFSDPAYGGNRDMVGWKLVGYPGAQRAYSVEALHAEEPPQPPQALRELPHFHPGVTEPDAHPNVIKPVRDGNVPEIDNKVDDEGQ